MAKKTQKGKKQKELGKGKEVPQVAAVPFVFPEINVESDLLSAQIGSSYNILLSLIAKREYQPRVYFGPEDLLELATSLKATDGAINPIIVHIVQKEGKTVAEIIAGERRWRASELAGKTHALCIIRPTCNNAGELLLQSLIENTHRVNTSPIEDAMAYQFLMNFFGWNQQMLSKKTGLDPFKISNAMQYLEVHEDVQGQLLRGEINKGTVKLLGAWPKEYQGEFGEILAKEAEKKGRALDHGEINIILKREAEERGIVNRPSRTGRSRPHLSHSEMVVNRIRMNLTRLSRSLDDLTHISGDKIAENEKIFFPLIEELNGFAARAKGEATRIKGRV